MNGELDTGWIEMVLPIERLDVNCIDVEEPKRLRQTETDIRYERAIIPFVYKTPIFKLQNLTVLTPFMKVHSWDSCTGRLSFDLEPNTVVYKKLTEFEQKIIRLLLNHRDWLGSIPDDTHAHIQNTLQYTIVDRILTVYLHGQNTSTKPMGRLWRWNQTMWTKGATQATFKKGQELRIAVRFQGVCFFPKVPLKSRYRIQHQTIAVYHKSE
jgi:hypothetical protein